MQPNMKQSVLHLFVINPMNKILITVKNGEEEQIWNKYTKKSSTRVIVRLISSAVSLIFKCSWELLIPDIYVFLKFLIN